MAREIGDEGAYRARAIEALKAAQDNLTQSHLETAVSRAYYACFYAVHSRLAALKAVAMSHKRTGILFRKYFIATGEIDKRFNATWSALQEHRMDADYAAVPSLDPERAKKLVSQAREFVEGLLAGG